jgi:hypothetical protein
MRNQRLYLNLRSGALVVALATIPFVPLKLNPNLPPPRSEGPKAQSTVDAPDAEFEPVFTQTVAPPDNMPGSFFLTNPSEGLISQLPRYTQVLCGEIDDVICYEICYLDRCDIYGNDDERVVHFKEMVDRAKELEDELELLRQGQIAAVIDAAESCLKAGAAAAGVKVALLALAAPYVTWTKVVAALAFLGAGVFCIGSVFRAWQIEGTKQDQVEDKISGARGDAVFEFNSLATNPP